MKVTAEKIYKKSVIEVVRIKKINFKAIILNGFDKNMEISLIK